MTYFTPTNFNIAASSDAANETYNDTHSSSRKKRKEMEELAREECVIHDSIESARGKNKKPLDLTRSPVLGKAPVLIPPKQFSAKTGLAEATFVGEGGEGASTESVDSESGLAGSICLGEEDPTLQKNLMQGKGVKGKKEVDGDAELAKEEALNDPSPHTIPDYDDHELPLPKNSNIIATLCYIMMVEVRVNSQYWSTNFDTASQDMNMIATLAPTAATAAKSVFDAQRNEEQQRADMANAQAWGQGVTAAATVGMGGVGAWRSSSLATKENNTLLAGDSEKMLSGTSENRTKFLDEQHTKLPELDRARNWDKMTLEQKEAFIRSKFPAGDPAIKQEFNRGLQAANQKDLDETEAFATPYKKALKKIVNEKPTLEQQEYAIQRSLGKPSEAGGLPNDRTKFDQGLKEAQEKDANKWVGFEKGYEKEYVENYLKTCEQPKYNTELEKIANESANSNKAAQEQIAEAMKEVAKNPEIASKFPSVKQEAGKGFWERSSGKALWDGFKSAYEQGMTWKVIGDLTSSVSQHYYEGKIAQAKTDQGNNTANQKISEYFIQYKQTDYERQSQLTNQAQEFINTFLNSITSEVQEISQTSRAMFQH